MLLLWKVVGENYSFQLPLKESMSVKPLHLHAKSAKNFTISLFGKKCPPLKKSLLFFMLSMDIKAVILPKGFDNGQFPVFVTLVLNILS